MLIDWFTVLAQIVNFLILVALLRYFLYEPIIKAMDDREARIAADLEAAEGKRAAAAQEIKTYQEKNRELEAQREEWLRQAKEDVATRQKEMSREARQSVDEAKERWQRALEQEKETFLQEARQRAGHQVYAVLQQALGDMAGVDLEERLVELFMQRLEALNGAARQAIVAALDEPDQEVAIYSAHELPPALRSRLATAVQPFRPRDADNGIRFATDPGLIAGLELRAGGYKVAWSLADYLDSLEEALAGVIRP